MTDDSALVGIVMRGAAQQIASCRVKPVPRAQVNLAFLAAAIADSADREARRHLSLCEARMRRAQAAIKAANRTRHYCPYFDYYVKKAAYPSSAPSLLRRPAACCAPGNIKVPLALFFLSPNPGQG